MNTAFTTRFLALDNTCLASASGRFTGLPDGRVHYLWDGPQDGPVVVLIHGFALHHVAFDHNVAALTSAGFRVLRMDNYGRGWSDRPHARHDASLFDRQLAGLLDALTLRHPVTLVGYSMGGAIAIHFAANHPDRVARLALIAPAGLPFAQPKAAKLIKLPVLGPLLMKAFGRRIMLNGFSKTFADYPQLRDEYVEKLGPVAQFPGYSDALVSTLLHYPLNHLEREWEKVGQSRIPTLVLWGEQDTTVPFPGRARLHALLPAAQLHTFPSEDHGIPMTVAGELNARLVKFLRDAA